MSTTTSQPGSSTDSPVDAAQFPEQPPVSPFRLLGTLGIAGALAGLLLVTVFQLTQPAIQAHKAKVLEDAVLEVLAGPVSYETLYLIDGALVSDPPAGVALRDLPRVYAGRGADGALDGFAVPAAKNGFQDKITLIFGFDNATGALRGMKVLESKETPGLGDKIEKDAAFVGQFNGRVADSETGLVGVKDAVVAANQIDMITGATISSRTVIAAINDALKLWRPALENYALGSGSSQEGGR